MAFLFQTGRKKEDCEHKQIVNPGIAVDSAGFVQVTGDLQREEALLLRWSMLAPDNRTVGRGIDIVFRDTGGLVKTVYMFMGIN